MAKKDSGGDGKADAAPDATPSAAQPANPPQMAVTAQYVKDFSFENPNAPQSLAPPSGQPNIEVNIDVKAQPLAPNNYEVELHIDIKASNADTALFVIELVYAGLFTLQNIPAENLEAVCLIECPRFIFPFARRVVADATRDGGFPPMLIDPIDFAALYRHRAQQKESAAPAPTDS
jgi:preprotein translocase subunit SecB